MSSTMSTSRSVVVTPQPAIAAWKQCIRTDWSVDQARVFKWTRGENLEQVHAAFENDVLHCGAAAVFAAVRSFWVPVYALPSEEVAQAVPAQQYCLTIDPADVKCQPGVGPGMLMRFNRELKASSAGVRWLGICSVGKDGSSYHRFFVPVLGVLCSGFLLA